jgi:hypothetical protein
MVKDLKIAVALLVLLSGTATAQRKPVPIQPGQAQCWDVSGTIHPTVQCSDGRWQVSNPDGTYLTGAGPLPAEYQPPPPDNIGPPPLSQFAPGFLFGGGAAVPPPAGR